MVVRRFYNASGLGKGGGWACSYAAEVLAYQSRLMTISTNASTKGVPHPATISSTTTPSSQSTSTTPRRLPPRKVPTWGYMPFMSGSERDIDRISSNKTHPHSNTREPSADHEPPKQTKEQTHIATVSGSEIHKPTESANTRPVLNNTESSKPEEAPKHAKEDTPLVSNESAPDPADSLAKNANVTPKTLEMAQLAAAIGEEIKATDHTEDHAKVLNKIEEDHELSTPAQREAYVEEAFEERIRLAAERESIKEEIRTKAASDSESQSPAGQGNSAGPAVVVQSSQTGKATSKLSQQEAEIAEAAAAAAKEAERKHQQEEEERRRLREIKHGVVRKEEVEVGMPPNKVAPSESVDVEKIDEEPSRPVTSFTPEELAEQQRIALQITRNKRLKSLLSDTLGLDLGQLLAKNLSAAAKALAAASKRERKLKYSQRQQKQQAADSTTITTFGDAQASSMPALVGHMGNTSEFIEEQAALRLHPQHGASNTPLAVTLVTPTAWGAAASDASFFSVASAAASAAHNPESTSPSDDIYIDPVTHKIYLPPRPIKVPPKLLVKQLRGTNPHNVNRARNPHAYHINKSLASGGGAASADGMVGKINGTVGGNVDATGLKNPSNHVSGNMNGGPYRNSARQLTLGMGGYPLPPPFPSTVDSHESLIDSISNNPYYQPNLVDDVYAASAQSESTADDYNLSKTELSNSAPSTNPTTNPHHSHNHVDWIDIQSHPTATLQEYLSSIASFMVDLDVHESLVQTTLDNVVLPQFSVADGCYALVLRSVVEELSSNTELDTIQELTNRMTIIAMPELGRVITVHRAAMPFVDEIISSWSDEHAPLATVNYITSLITQETVRTYHRAISESIVQFDGYEARLFVPQKQRAMLAREIYHIKRRASVFSRSLQLIQESYTNMSSGLGIQTYERSFQEVQQELIHVRSLSEELGDNATTVLALLFQLSSYQLNALMRVLTLFSAFFIPLTFIASVCGMGFDTIGFGRIGTEDDGRPIYKYVIRNREGWNTNLVVMSMVGSAVGLLVSFRMKGLL